MAIEIVWGKVSNRLAVDGLVSALNNLSVDGTLYIGYPILASADSSVTIEALLVSQTPGLIVFHFPANNLNENDLREMQDRLGYAMDANLSRHESLRSGRRIGITSNIISYFAHRNINLNSCAGYLFADNDNLAECFNECISVPPELIRSLHAAIQRVTTIKPQKRRDNVIRENSRGAILKNIEKNIANLDQWQKKAAIETPEGPQRVRGLAGSGKTIVLALKAAYLHAQHPDWDIAVTFNTLSLIPQFTDLIERFSIEHSGDKPKWEKLQILPAWGSHSSPGVYSKIASAINSIPMDYTSAVQKYGRRNAFDGLCEETLVAIKNSPVELFDAILIDEAQDLPVSFFRLVYEATKPPKRIVFAYDELQNLNNTVMLTISELFNNKISLSNTANSPQQDIILPICYRNTPWALTLAHALGFGINRKEGIVQLFDELDLWKDIGYEVVSGSLNFNADVTLKRRNESYPSFFPDLLNVDDAISVQKFQNEIEQYEWLANEIKKNIRDDELDPDDILIILPDAYTAKKKYPDVSDALLRHGINSHLAGVSSMRDIFAIPGSVTVSGIYRAKGNEAAMVYIINADYCVEESEIIKKRNTLFTAITRSRAWVRICGIGDGMDALLDEIRSVKSNGYVLSFHIPSQKELSRIRLINRDRTSEEKEKIKKAQKSIDDLSLALDDGSILPEDLPKLKELIRKVSRNSGQEI